MYYLSSVNNKKLEYSTDTKYVDELNFAVNLWNSENKVSIVKLPWVKTGDLYITDNYADFKDWAWVYWKNNNWRTSVIILNKYFMDWDSVFWEYTKENKIHNIAHELWHSLWLAHSYPENILHSWKQSYTKLWKQDKKDLNFLY